MPRKLALFLLIGAFAEFAALNVWAVAGNGLMPLLEQALATPGGKLLTADLAIALTLVAVWVHRDAKARGANAWAWVVATFATGSLAPLAYLIKRTLQDKPAEVTRPVRAAA